jgi:SNF2 family DNA or RNA helicase
MTAHVTLTPQNIEIRCESFDHRAKEAPVRKWNPNSRSWQMPLTDGTATYIFKHYATRELCPKAAEKLRLIQGSKPVVVPFPVWYKFKNKPMDHQNVALAKMWNERNFALFMEMGTGKTFTIINWAAAMFMNKDIEAMLVVCPTSVKPVWIGEMDAHCPIEHSVHIVESGKSAACVKWMEEAEGLKVMVVGVEALSSGGAYNSAIDFVINHKAAMVIDESSRIKTHSATRTKRCIKLGEVCQAKAILTGTPITQGMQDLYAQFAFLDKNIIGQKSYFGFQNRYCTMGGFEGRKITGYKHINEIMDLVAPHTYIVKKDDVLDLPPKVYESITVKPSKEQARILKDVGDAHIMGAQMGDLDLEVETVLERMIRYQQIVGGMFPYDEEDGTHGITPISGPNPKLDAMCDMIKDLDVNAKVIIWARFVPEQRMIAEYLNNFFGPSVAWYSAGATTSERKQMIEDFQDPHSTCRFFLSNPTMGGIGLTLTAASYVIYYSNSFSLEDRLQSEDRAHRKGQTKSVTYIDIMMDHKIDRDIVAAIKSKKSVADYVESSIIDAQTSY